jgi:hypothetical protein
MRPQAEIEADPEATAEEIYALSGLSAFAALQHPNCPADLWWKLAIHFPIEAPATPAGALFLLEEPERWEALETQHANTWLNDWLRNLTEPMRWQFGADCAERVLPLFEAAIPGDAGPRLAIAAARKFAKGKITKEALLEARTAAFDSAVPSAYGDVISLAAKAAAEITSADFRSTPSFAAEAVYDVAWKPNQRYGSIAYDKERVWQWHRLLQYLRAEIK